MYKKMTTGDNGLANQIEFYDGSDIIDRENVIDFMLKTGRNLSTGKNVSDNVALTYNKENGWVLVVFGHNLSSGAAILYTYKTKLNKNHKEHLMSFIDRALNGELKEFAIYQMA